MNLVDSCGWLEYFAGGPNLDFYAPVLEVADETILVPTICLYEVFKRVLIQFGRDQAVEKAATMRAGRIIDLTETLALEAAILSREIKLPMADSIILATARRHDAVVWTQDAHFAGIEGGTLQGGAVMCPVWSEFPVPSGFVWSIILTTSGNPVAFRSVRMGKWN